MTPFEQLYYHPDKGYVVRYQEPACIQLAYSIMKINFFADEFERFRNMLTQLLEKHAHSQADETMKAVFIPTPDPAMEIILSVKELKELIIMTESADSEMKTRDILKIFNKPL